MKTVPASLTIAFWITDSSWALALFAYLSGEPLEWIFPIIILGTITGVAEWVLRQKLR
jgi:hypothetical protein